MKMTNQPKQDCTVRPGQIQPTAFSRTAKRSSSKESVWVSLCRASAFATARPVQLAFLPSYHAHVWAF